MIIRITAALWILIFAALLLIQSDAAEPEACVDPETREVVRGLMQDGINTAMRNHTTRMFDGWMKDPTDQPRRAINGMNTAARAYMGAHLALKNWNPPSCKGDRL